jgi:hypothetical protein
MRQLLLGKSSQLLNFSYENICATIPLLPPKIILFLFNLSMQVNILLHVTSVTLKIETKLTIKLQTKKRYNIGIWHSVNMWQVSSIDKQTG